MTKKTFYSPRRQMRMMIVMVVYQYELSNKPVNLDEIFEQDIFNQLFDYKKMDIKNVDEIIDEQMKILKIIEKNYLQFKKLISNFIRLDWTWDRINPIVRSILLVACVELKKLDIGIVTNEYVEITKDLIPDKDDYKFVNKTIEQIGKLIKNDEAN